MNWSGISEKTKKEKGRVGLFVLLLAHPQERRGLGAGLTQSWAWRCQWPRGKERGAQVASGLLASRM
jgi:hypothetical protein